jgi:uncharacterized membrane protein
MGMKTEHIYHRLTLLFALVGLADSLYLSWVKLSHTTALCLPGIGDCDKVNTSRYAELFGIPIAIFGALTYLALIAILLLHGRWALLRETHLYLVFGIGLFGVLFSAYLTYLEIAVIHAICPFCVLSALMMVGIFCLSILRLSQDQARQNP